jgi:L-malate glycosyltransferase
MNSALPPLASRSLRIIFVIDEMEALTAGGTERQILQMAHLLMQQGFYVHVCAFRGTEWLREHDPDLPFHSAGIRGFLHPRNWRALWGLLLWIRAGRFEVIQSFFVEANILCPFLGWCVGVPVRLGSRRNLNYWMGRGQRFLQRLGNRFVTRLVANCEAVRTAVSRTESFPRERIDVLHNGLDLRTFTEDPARRAALRSSYGLSPETLLIGTVVSLRPFKGVESFLESARLVHAADPALRFLVVGDGPLRQALVDSVKRAGMDGQILFAGAQKDVPAYLRAFDIAVLSSLSEGFSNSLLEYMAAGLPIIATDVGGNGEALAGAGILVPPNSPRDLTAAMLGLARDAGRRHALGDAARVRATHFSLEATASRLAQYYRALSAPDPTATMDS